jgi:hypothetical protein
MPSIYSMGFLVRYIQVRIPHWLHWLHVCNCRLPPGVINVLPGGSDVGRFLVTHSQVSKVMFSGLTGVGRLLRKQTAGLGMHLTLCKLTICINVDQNIPIS